MLLEKLRKEVLEANLELVRRGLVVYTFGNASGIDRETALVAIKPSGVPYEELKPEHMVVSDLEGKIVEGNLRDLLQHYQAEPNEAEKLIAVGESKADAKLDKPTLAAYTMVANELMNLDEVLNK